MKVGGGGGVHAHPLLLCLPSRKKLQCTLQLRVDALSYFISTPICTLWSSLKTEAAGWGVGGGVDVGVEA
jgi:hypothetical protein